MGKRQQHTKYTHFRFTKTTIISLSVLAALVFGLTFYVYNSLIPVNGTTPVFAAPNNHYIKTKYDSKSGYSFVGMSSGRAKGVRTSGSTGSSTNPTLVFAKDYPQTVRIINEDNSPHNFNIKEFNVHSKDLGFFQNQAITFVPNIKGTFEYYCTIHPEMKGTIEVE